MADDQDVHDVTVRIPVHMTAAGAAGFIHAAVARAMEAADYVGEPAVLFRKDGNGPIVMFFQGLEDPYEGPMPHALVDESVGKTGEPGD